MTNLANGGKFLVNSNYMIFWTLLPVLLKKHQRNSYCKLYTFLAYLLYESGLLFSQTPYSSWDTSVLLFLCLCAPLAFLDFLLA